MPKLAKNFVMTDRDRQVLSLLFENRVMLLGQIKREVFAASSLPAASRRIAKLCRAGFVERRGILGSTNRMQSLFMNTPKGLEVIAGGYRFVISTALCKSDSIEHDVTLVDIRRRLQKLEMVSDYFTENMLQACQNLSEVPETRPFVGYNTDAVVELKRQNRKFFVGFEFENSEKAHERYVRKLLSYYADHGTTVILWVCANARIQTAVASAEKSIIAERKPRCFYGLTADVLAESVQCTFVDLNGAKIVLR